MGTSTSLNTYTALANPAQATQAAVGIAALAVTAFGTSAASGGAASPGFTPVQSNIQQGELWMIHAKGKIKRAVPWGDPKIEKAYHAALEDGRYLERNIGDAQHWLQQKKKDLTEKISMHLRMHQLAVDGQLPKAGRAPKYVADAILIMNDVQSFQQEILGLISAVTGNIGMLLSMEAQLIAAIQMNLNAIASLLNEICNWGLPNLPSVPNLFSDSTWHWNGIQFAPLSQFAKIAKSLKFDTNFAFSQCVLHTPNLNIFSNYPSSVTNYGGLTYGTPAFVPPLGGLIPSTTQNMSDPSFIAELQNPSNTPYYLSPSAEPVGLAVPFNLNNSMQGAVPLPATIISNYQMPPATYQNNIVSIIPALVPLVPLAGGGEPSFSVPTGNYTSTQEEAITDSATDSNGVPLPIHYTTDGTTPTTSSPVYSNPIPVSSTETIEAMVNDGSGDVNSATLTFPVPYPDMQKALAHYVTLGQVVASNYDPNLTAAWLFYLDKNHTGRAGQWVSAFQSAYTLLVTPSLTYLGNTPVPWNCVYPCTQINNTPPAIPLIGTLTGASATTQGNWLWQLSYIEASLLGYPRNTTWDAYANIGYVTGYTGTDLDYKETTIGSNSSTIVLGEGTAEYPTSCTFPSSIGHVLQEVIAMAAINIQNTPTYTAVKPQFKYVYNQFAVANEVDRFSQFWRTFNANLQALLVQDPYLIQFVVSYAASLDSAIDPLGDPTIYNQLATDAATRNRNWTAGGALLVITPQPNVAYYSTSAAPNGWTDNVFDPVAFLNRPDIQSQTIPVQMAMLRTNLSYSAVLQQGQTMCNTINQAVSDAIAQISDFQGTSFTASASANVNSIPSGSIGATVAFDVFTSLPATSTPTCATVAGNIFTFQTAGNYALSVELNWGEGDAGVRTGSILLNGTTVINTSSTGTTQTGPTLTQMSTTQYFNVGDTLTVLATHNLPTAQSILANSGVAAIQTDASAPAPSAPAPSTSTNLTQSITAGVDMTAPITAVAVASDGTVKPVDPTTVLTGPSGTIFPFVDGLVLTPTTKGSPATVAMTYGGVYSVTDTPLTTGGLMYVIADGVVTQDYSLVSPLPWVVVVGRALSSTQFIFEPHIPTLS